VAYPQFMSLCQERAEREPEECLEPVDLRHEALLLRVEVRDLRR